MSIAFIAFSVSPVEKYIGYFKFIRSLISWQKNNYNEAELLALTNKTPVEYTTPELCPAQTLE